MARCGRGWTSRGFVRLAVTALLVAASLGAVESSAVATAPPARHGGPVTALTVLTPAADTAVAQRATVRLRVAVTGPAKQVLVKAGSHHVTLSRRGSTWSASVPATWLRAGRNRLLVTAVGTDGSHRYATRTLYRAGRPGGLGLRVSDASGAGGAAVTITSTRPVAALSVWLNGHDLTAHVPLGRLRQTLYLGAREGLVRGANSLRVLAVREGGGFQNASATVRVASTAPLPMITSPKSPPDGLDSGRVARDSVPARAGATVSLDASGSRPAISGHQLSYRWRLVSGPTGAHPVIGHRFSAHATFTTTVPGRYVLQVSATETSGGTGVQRVKLDVAPAVPPVGEPLVTQAPGGIYVGGTTYPPAAQQPLNLVLLDRGSLAVLGTASGGTSAASITALSTAITSATSSGQYTGQGIIAVLSAPAGYSCTPIANACGPFESLLQQLFVDDPAQPAQNDKTISGGFPFSTITLTGPADHSVWRSSRVPSMTAPLLPGAAVGAGDITGYLNLHEVPGQTVGPDPALFVPDTDLPLTTSYSSTPTSNVMRIGRCLQDLGIPPTPGMPECQTFASDTLTTCGTGPTGGFQVVVLWAASLAQIANRTFTTNGGCGSAGVDGDVAQLQAMTQFVDQYAHSGGTSDYLVIVQSIGAPHPQTAVAVVNQAWSAFGSTEVTKLGGTASVFDYLGAQSGYALVGYSDTDLPGFGRPFGAEASGDVPHTSATPPPAVINGALTRNQRNDYYPQTYASVGGPTLDGLETIASRPATPWPAEDTPGERAALAYLTTEMISANFITNWGPEATGQCWGIDNYSIRDIYCDTTRAGELTVPTAYPSGQSFSSTEWATVTGEIQAEVGMVHSVAQVLLPQLQLPFLNTSSSYVDFQQVVQDIDNAVNPPPAAPTTSPWAFWLGILADVGSTVADFVGLGADALGAFVDGIAEGFGIGSSLVPSGAGSAQSLLAQRVQDTASNIETDIPTIYGNVIQSLTDLEPLLVTDFGKLVRAANIPLLADSGLDTAHVVAAVTRATKAWGTPLLLSAAFKLDGLNSAGPSVSDNTTFYASGPYTDDAANFSCYYQRAFDTAQHPYRPFPTASPNGQYVAAAPARTYLLATKGDPSTNGTVPTAAVVPAVPPDSVLAPLFAPATAWNDETHLSLLKDHVFTQSFDVASARSVTCPISPGYPGDGLAAAGQPYGNAGVFYTFAKSGQSSAASYQLYADLQDPRSGAWSGPTQLPGQPDVPDTSASNLGQQQVPLSASSPGPGSFNVYFVQKGALVNDYVGPGGSWGGPGGLPGKPDPLSNGGGIAGASHGDGDQYLFFWQNNGIVVDQDTGAGWQGPVPVVPDASSPGNPETELAALAPAPGQLIGFYLTFNSDTANIVAATFANGAWTTTTAVPNVDQATPLAATMDGAGHPCIVFTSGSDGSNTNLWISCNDGGGWNASTIATDVGFPVFGLSASSSLPHQIQVALIPPKSGFHNVVGTYTWDPTVGWQAGRNLPVPPWRAN